MDFFAFINALFQWAVDISNKLLATREKSLTKYSTFNRRLWRATQYILRTKMCEET